MSHYAKVENGIVTQVIVAEADFIATGALGDPASWLQTSYNTRMGVHFNQEGVGDAEGFRGNYAGIGYTYDAEHDVFYAPQPAPEFVLDTDTWTWWNPTDPEAVKPVKPEIIIPVVEAPVEIAPVEQAPVIVDVPAEVVAEVPVDAVVAPVTETPVSNTPTEQVV